MFRALPALVLGLLLGCTSTGGAPPTGSPVTASVPASIPAPVANCGEATLTITNGTTQLIGVTLNGDWAGSVEKNSTRTVDPRGIDQLPPLPWVAVVTDAKGAEVGSLLVQAGSNETATVADEGGLVTGAALRPGCTATPDPYAGLPSNACGGFHLKVVNNTSGKVTVVINAGWSTTIDSGGGQVINEMFTQPQPPMLPWYVVIKDATGRPMFEGIAGDSPVDQKVTLTDDGAPSQAPYSLALEGCGPA